MRTVCCNHPDNYSACLDIVLLQEICRFDLPLEIYSIHAGYVPGSLFDCLRDFSLRSNDFLANSSSSPLLGITFEARTVLCKCNLAVPLKTTLSFHSLLTSANESATFCSWSFTSNREGTRTPDGEQNKKSIRTSPFSNSLRAIVILCS